MLSPGDQLERYTVVGPLGSGAMGTVYRVRHQTLGVEMALKVLHAEGAAPERLVAEGRLQASLRHPGIVSVADLLDLDGRPALVMERVDGQPLDAWVRTERPDLDERIRVFRLLVEAVGYAHGKGVVHRDIKPVNVLIEREGSRPRITDFGIAGLVQGEASKVAGSPAYMAPEQFRQGARPDVRADLWSLGVVLYELCCDQRPFAGDDLTDLQQAMASRDYPAPAGLRSDLPDPVVAAITACLQPDPRARPADCAALLSLLDQGRPASADPVETWESATFEVDDGEPASAAPEAALAPAPQTAPALASPTALVQPTDGQRVSASARAALGPALAAGAVSGGLQLVALLGGSPLLPVLGTAVGWFLLTAGVLWAFFTGLQLYAQGAAETRLAPVQPGSLRARWRQLPRGVRLAVGTGAPFGVAMGLMAGVLSALKGTSVALALGLVLGSTALGGAAFGGFMALFLGLVHAIGHSDGGQRGSTRMSCEQQFSAVVGGPPDEVYPEAERLVAELGIARVLEADPDRASLAIVTAPTGDAGGSVVDVRVVREGELTVAHVASRPVLATQLVDNGSNKRIVDQLVAGLLDRFPVELDP